MIPTRRKPTKVNIRRLAPEGGFPKFPIQLDLKVETGERAGGTLEFIGDLKFPRR